MMENSERSTNSQRADELRAFSNLVVTAIFFLTIVTAIALLSRALEQDTKDLEARCKSLGGVAGQTKCFKNGKEV